MKSLPLSSASVDALLWVLASAILLIGNIAIAFCDVAWGRGGKALRDMEGEA